MTSINREYLKNMDRAVFREVFEENVYRLTEEEVRDRIVVDIGACIGYFTLRCVEIGAKQIISVEPQPINFSPALTELTRDHSTVKIFNLAISENDDDTVYIPYMHTRSAVNTSGVGDPVKTITLKTLIQDLPNEDLILKMDCEGSEFNVFMNIEEEVVRRFEIICIEIHGNTHENSAYQDPNLVREKLKSFGYEKQSSVQCMSYPNGDLTATPTSIETYTEKWVRVEKKPKYSIIIPTYNHCDDLLKPCIESIKQFTTLDKVEVIVVANGCTDNTKEYVNSLPQAFKLIWFDNALGFTKATNEGIKQARGDYIVILNNDIELLPQVKDVWLTLLQEPFNTNSKLGLTGALKLYDHDVHKEFLVFCCTMIKKEVFDRIGLLDEIFNPGYGEDIDFTLRAVAAGYEFLEPCPTTAIEGMNVSTHPSWHKNNKTFGEIPEYGGIVARNKKILIERYSKVYKYSIVIPTYNHCDDLLKPCINSIINTTDLSNIEVIIVANGCTDNTKEYVEKLGPPFKLIWIDEAIGYTKATNVGVRQASGEYVILMNNDVILLQQQQNYWLQLLEAPFANNKTGITGPVKFTWNCGGIQRAAMAFWLVMIKKTVFDKIGILDEVFSPGMGEDGDFCIRAELFGYNLVAVPDDVTGEFDTGIKAFNFPIYHVGNGTFADEIAVKNEVIERNSKILSEKYGANSLDVTIVIPTYNHFEDAFKPCIDAVLRYTNLSNKEIIVVANGCTDGTRNYLDSLVGKVQYIWFDEPTGVVRAYNAGISRSRGKYTVMIDNDSILIEQEIDTWINILKRPFLEQEKVGGTSPFANEYEDMGFVLHSGCTMYNTDLLKQIGMFDEIYNPGYFCDPDVSMKIWRAGYRCVEVPIDRLNKPYKNGAFEIMFPVVHMGTVQTMDKHKDIEIVKKNREILYNRYGKTNMIKYSIVIPTYNHCDDLLRPCIESIVRYTDLENVEIIVVANGCSDNTKEYLSSLATFPVKMIWIDEPIGYTKATNEGIKVACGEFIILLNNDTELLEYPKNAWLQMMEEHFTDSSVGLVGPLQLHDNYADADVLIFFCVMIRKEVFDKIGLLDEIFSPGGGEDIDFTIRANKAGYKSVVATPTEFDTIKSTNTGGIPIWHKDNKTFKDIPEYTNYIVKRNGLINCKRYNKDIKLNIGGGGIHHPGFLSVDLYDKRADILMDITKLDFEDNSVSEIIASHVFEHLNPYHSLNILQEWRRVLKPGCKLAMEMPDIEQLCKRFVTATTGERYGILNAIYGSVNTTGEGGPDNITSPHLFGWWPQSIHDHLHNAGFRNITFMDEQWPHPESNLRVEAIK